MKTGTQRFKKTVVTNALITAFCGTATMMFAQETLAQTGSSLQRVEVTGSNIRRTDTETASPVQVITKDEIDQSGKGTVAEYLQTLTSDGQGSVPFTYGRGFSGATSSGISLRGLGANATLVLINGRRVTSAVLADDAQRTYVDLNQIPLEAVERVEVLKDGASSVYGSDAVAGVVNIILKKNYQGTVAKLTYGVAEQGDGAEPRVAITHGMGDLDKDGYNLLLNAEFGKRAQILYRDRAGRGSVGVSAIGQPQWGFDPNSGPTNNISFAGGMGWIPTSAPFGGTRIANSAGQSIIGNVRNPDPLNNSYYSRGDAAGVGFTRTFPAAQAYCLANANLPQNNTAGGCIVDLRQAVNQVQPDSKTASFFGRFTKTINANMEGFVELGYYQTQSDVTGLPVAPNGGFFRPNGDVVSRAATTLLGATHPDNPYFGSTARLRYMPLFDTGPSNTASSGHSLRLVAGLRGTWDAWDYDTAVHYSEAKQTDVSQKLIDYRVADALLNPTAANVTNATRWSPQYAALVAANGGTPPFWRIGENANLNSPALYNALLSDQQRSGFSRIYGADIKVSRELGKMDGGPIGLAIGAEVRHEANGLPLYNGLGNYLGVSLTAYGGERNLWATYGEMLFPVTKALEISAALRYDHYSDAGNSFTPKIGAKLKALPNLAFRSTYSRGFRAPSSTENSLSSVAAFGGAVVDDNARCAALIAGGMNQQTAEGLCKGIAPTFVQRGNPALEPEKSESWTFGTVWDITPKTSLTLDAWQIKRKGLPVIEDPQEAIDAGRFTRDPATAVQAGDPGGILSGFVVFRNSAQSLTRGIDLEAKHRWDLGGGMGKITAGFTWTHLLVQRVVDQFGTVHDYAGTHGDCNITNCIGSPRDRISFNGTWEMGPYRFGTNVNYRGSMKNTFEQSDTTCAQTLLNGADFPSGCKVKSFTTVDVNGVWKIRPGTELGLSIQNLFDKKPPADFETYGAIGYNPLDYSGAIGRFYRLSLKHSFR
ncbi:TonB-dependent receptor [Caenimonas koreensis]|uniref:TonB-dependent receptor n=1 Tax=Caenimonas koreensis TaxID=367474 RepID=UPI00378304A4